MVDRDNHRIQVFNERNELGQGELNQANLMNTRKKQVPRVFGEKGNEMGQFKYIQGIAVNSSGTIFVNDSGRVMIASLELW